MKIKTRLGLVSYFHSHISMSVTHSLISFDSLWFASSQNLLGHDLCISSHDPKRSSNNLKYSQWPNALVSWSLHLESKKQTLNSYWQDLALIGIFKHECCKFASECQWQNFVNRLTFGKVMGKSLVSCFLTHSVPISVVPPCLFVHNIGSDVVWCYWTIL